MLAAADFQPHWVENHPAALYHGDKLSVSSTELRRMHRSPHKFRMLRKRPPTPTKAMEFGTLVHGFVLEGADYLKRYVVMPDFKLTHGHPNSNVHKAAKGEWLLANIDKLVVTQDELDDVHGILDSLINHQDAFDLLKQGVTEISGYYRDPETGILCRIRPDFLAFDLTVLIDLKTTQDIEEERFSNEIWKWRYDFQMAMYGEGTEQISGRKVEHHALIACEKEYPYEVAVYHLDEPAIETGARDYHRSLRRLKECIDTDRWPGYQTSVKDIGLPMRALTA